MGSTPRGPFTDQITQPLQAPRLPADNPAAMAGWGGPFEAITQFATSFLRGASEGRQAQREQAEQQRARNISALQMLGQQVSQSNLIEPEKQSIQRDIMQRLVGEIASTKPPDKKNASPLFSFVTQTARNLLGPGAPKVKPLGDEDLGALYQRMQGGKTVDAVQREALELWNQAANESKDSSGNIIKQRLLNHPLARQGYQALAGANVPLSEPMKVFLNTVGVTPQESMMLGLYDEIGGASGQPEVPPQPQASPIAAPQQGQAPVVPAANPAASIVAAGTPMSQAANQFSMNGGSPVGTAESGPLQSIAQLAAGPLPWQAQGGGTQAQTVAQPAPGAAPQQAAAPVAQGAPRSVGRFPMLGEGDTALEPASQSLIGGMPLSPRQRMRASGLQQVFGARTREYTLWNEKTGERIRVLDYGVVDPATNQPIRVEAGTEFPIQGVPEASGFVNIGNQRPPMQKPRNTEEIQGEMNALMAAMNPYQGKYPDLYRDYQQVIRSLSRTSSDPVAAMSRAYTNFLGIVRGKEDADIKREEVAARRAQAQAEAQRGRDDRELRRTQEGWRAIDSTSRNLMDSSAYRTFNQITGIARAANAAFEDLQSPEAQRNRHVQGYNDQVLINAIARMADPQTGVRDAERQLFIDAQGWKSRIEARAAGVIDPKGQILSDSARKSIIHLINKVKGASERQILDVAKPAIQRLEKMAGSYGIDNYDVSLTLPEDLARTYKQAFGSQGGSGGGGANPFGGGARGGASSDNPFAAPARGSAEPPKPGSGTPKLF